MLLASVKSVFSRGFDVGSIFGPTGIVRAEFRVARATDGGLQNRVV